MGEGWEGITACSMSPLGVGVRHPWTPGHMPWPRDLQEAWAPGPCCWTKAPGAQHPRTPHKVAGAHCEPDGSQLGSARRQRQCRSCPPVGARRPRQRWPVRGRPAPATMPAGPGAPGARNDGRANFDYGGRPAPTKMSTTSSMVSARRQLIIPHGRR